jgi:hypothetical protein
VSIIDVKMNIMVEIYLTAASSIDIFSAVTTERL